MQVGDAVIGLHLDQGLELADGLLVHTALRVRRREGPARHLAFRVGGLERQKLRDLCFAHRVLEDLAERNAELENEALDADAIAPRAGVSRGGLLNGAVARRVTDSCYVDRLTKVEADGRLTGLSGVGKAGAITRAGPQLALVAVGGAALARCGHRQALSRDAFCRVARLDVFNEAVVRDRLWRHASGLGIALREYTGISVGAVGDRAGLAGAVQTIVLARTGTSVFTWMTSVGVVDAGRTAQRRLGTPGHGIASIRGAVISIRTVDGSKSLTGAVEAFVLTGAHRAVIAGRLIVRVGAVAVGLTRVIRAWITVIAEVLVRLTIAVVVDPVTQLDGARFHLGVQGLAVIDVRG